jgi:hypothetical protein
VTARDRGVLIGVAVVGLIGAFWLLALSPKRSELKKLDTQVSESEQAVATARQEADQFAKDRLAFPSSYTTMVRLGKAVPKGSDVPSLIVQLDHVAHDAGVNFRSLKFEASGSSSGAAAAPAAPTTPPPATSTGAGTTGATGQAASSGTSGAATTSSSSSTSSPGGTSSTSSTSSSSTGASATAGAATADATAAATLPLGTQMGPAQLPTMKLNLVFQGSFFKMADLIHNIRQLVKRQNHQLLVSGRLLTVDGISFQEGDFGYPQVKATMVTTAYLLPVAQGILDGATVQGPAGATTPTPATASTGAAATAPPVAVVSP